MTNDDIATLMNNAAGQDWGTEMHFRRFAYMLLVAEREAIIDEWCMRMQSDLENGVRYLNEKAAEEWQRKYPEMSKFGQWLSLLQHH